MIPDESTIYIGGVFYSFQSDMWLAKYSWDKTTPTSAILAPANASSQSTFPAVSGTAADNVAVSTVEVRISSGPNYFYSRPFLASSFVFRCERQAM